MQNYAKFTINHSLRFKGIFFGVIFLSAFNEGMCVQNPDLHFGVYGGGVVTTTFSTAGPWKINSSKTNIGFGGGAFFEWDFSKKKQWFAYLELGVSSAKIEASSPEADTALGAFSLSAKYLNITPAIGIGYHFFPRESSFNMHLLACVVGNFPERNGTPAITIKKQEVSQNLDKTVGARLECGIHYEFAALILRYEYTFLPIIQVQNQKFNAGHFDFLIRFKFF